MQTDNQNNTNTPSFLEKTKRWYRALPDKKRYLEFITALLTIPVLLTVAISNVMNLRQNKATPTPAITTTAAVAVTPTPTPTPTL